MLSDRSLAWLRHLDGVTATSEDLLASALSVGLLARRTPAWTEPHLRILDRLIDRASTDRGVEARPGPNADPGPGADLGRDGSRLLLLLGLRAAFSPSGATSVPGRDPAELAEQLCQRWETAPLEDVSGSDDLGHVLDRALAGLGLRLHDTTNGTDLHQRAFAPWWDRVRASLVEPGTTTGDPVSTLTLALLLAPQAPDDARHLFDAGAAALTGDHQFGSPLQAERATALALLGARVWNAEGRAQELALTVESSPGVSFEGDTDGPRPFGSSSALLAMAEAIEVTKPNRGTEAGWWSALFTEPVAPCPQLVGVDFPDVALFRAEWINGVLHVGQAPSSENRQRWTTFRLVGDEPRMWYLTGIDGAMMDTAGSAVVVRVPQVRGELEFAPGSY